MPDDHRRAQLRQLDEKTRAKRRPWGDWAIVVVLLALTIIVVLFFLRSTGSRGLFSDAASSVSNAPGP